MGQDETSLGSLVSEPFLLPLIRKTGVPPGPLSKGRKRYLLVGDLESRGLNRKTLDPGS